MGRNSTGAWTTNECMRIELSYLLKAGYLVRDKQTSGSLNWNRNGEPLGRINIVSSWPSDPAKRPYIRLTYTSTNSRTNKREEHDDTIYLEARPSNLGKGEVLYFICPSSSQRCRILCKAYSCPIWKSRASYQHRIYYPSQQSSKREAANNRYWDLDKQINRLVGKRRAGTYRGKPTRRAKQLERLEELQREADHQRWSSEAMTLGLRRALSGK